jgi:hypothetical protein
MTSRGRLQRRAESGGSSTDDDDIPWTAAFIQSGNHVSTIHLVDPSIRTEYCLWGIMMRS